MAVSLFLLELEIGIVDFGTVKLPEANGGNIREFVGVKSQRPIQRRCFNQVSYRAVFACCRAFKGVRDAMSRLLQLDWARDDNPTTHHREREADSDSHPGSRA